MGMQARNKKLFAKVQAAVGVPETITNADAVRTSGLALMRYAGNRVSRNYDRAGLGSQEQVNVSPHSGLSNFMVPFTGSGDTDVAPAWSDLLLACGVAITDDTVAEDEWYFTPVDNGWKDCTLVIAEELIQQLIGNVRGNFSITANPGELPVFNFSNFIGTYARPVALALTAPDDSDFLDAVPVTFSNTTLLTVDGDAYPVSGFTFDAGVAVEWVNQPNRQEAVVTDRTPSGTIILSPAQAAQIVALYADVESHAGVVTTVPIILSHGTGAGNILKLNIYAAQLSEISEQVFAGEVYFSLPFQVLPDASGDEWRLTQS